MTDVLNQILEKLDVMNRDMHELKSDVSVLKSDVSQLKSDVSVLKSDVSQLKSDVKHLDERLTSVEKNTELIPAMRQAIFETSAEIKEIKSTIVTKDDLDYYDKKIAQHDREIFKMKNA